MKDQVLSIEKMQKLKELGVDASKASMCYVFFESDGSKYTDIVVHDESCYEMACMNPIPTFTLQDLIELMPCEFWATDGNPYELEINNKHIGYVNSMHDYKEPLYYNWNDNLLENTYNMLVFLAENKYI